MSSSFELCRHAVKLGQTDERTDRLNAVLFVAGTSNISAFLASYFILKYTRFINIRYTWHQRQCSSRVYRLSDLDLTKFGPNSMTIPHPCTADLLILLRKIRVILTLSWRSCRRFLVVFLSNKVTNQRRNTPWPQTIPRFRGGAVLINKKWGRGVPAFVFINTGINSNQVPKFKGLSNIWGCAPRPHPRAPAVQR